MSNIFEQYSETDPLKKVIIGRYKGYRKVDEYVEIVNDTQRAGLPTKEQLAEEFTELKKILENNGVEVLIPEYVGKFVYDQLTPRDIGVTIGNKFVICNMAKSSRRYEVTGIFDHILEMEGPEPNILMPENHDTLIEGGDIIVDNGTIFVGLTNRTNKGAINFLRMHFGDSFDLIPVPCRSTDPDEDVLHLDCIFNPVGKEHALIYADGMENVPAEIIDSYKLIEINKGAQQALGTNVLSINEDLVISRDHKKCRAVNEALRNIGIEVVTLPFDGAPSTGGSVRCCTLPLHRERS